MSNREKKLKGKEKTRRYIGRRSFLHHMTTRMVNDVKEKAPDTNARGFPPV